MDQDNSDDWSDPSELDVIEIRPGSPESVNAADIFEEAPSANGAGNVLDESNEEAEEESNESIFVAAPTRHFRNVSSSLFRPGRGNLPLRMIRLFADRDSQDNEGEGEPQNARNLRNIFPRIRMSSDAQRYMRMRDLLEDRRSQDTEDNDNEAPLENAETFDTDLPGEHSYMGNMSRISGVDYLEPCRTYRLLVFMTYTFAFPGETLPMILPQIMFDGSVHPEEGLLFGVFFFHKWDKKQSNLFGVTCQIFEKGEDNRGNDLIKCRVLQRLVIRKKDNPNFADLLSPQQSRMHAIVEILPEIYLPDPLETIDLGSLNRFRGMSSMAEKLRNIQAGTTTLPRFVYEQYNVATIIEKAKKNLATYKISTMPTDPVQLSFWLARNLIFNDDKRCKVFQTNSVNDRMQILGKYLDDNRVFVCGRCGHKIGSFSELFAMSKHGVQSNYCNPSGFIHETMTIYSVLKDSVYLTGSPSTEFSWFPGYSWQIILCSLCNLHLGWKFKSTKTNLVPKSFFGLSGANIKVQLPTEPEDEGVQLDDPVSPSGRRRSRFLRRFNFDSSNM